jgi:hypothetical protein
MRPLYNGPVYVEPAKWCVVMPICPNLNCAMDMGVDTSLLQSEVRDSAGLSHFQCGSCGQRGIVVNEGLHLVFRAGRHYCFTYGSTPAQITVMVTAEAATTYKWSGVTEETLARYAAEWMLLCGHKSGAIILSPDQPVFVHFHRYVQDHVLLNTRPHVA